MDYKQFRKQLSEATGHTLADTDTLVEAFAAVLRGCGTELDAVAVPSFGTFTTEKHDEEIRTDAATGRRTLFPPEIRMDFTPGAVLLRKLSPVQEVIRNER